MAIPSNDAPAPAGAFASSLPLNSQSSEPVFSQCRLTALARPDAMEASADPRESNSHYEIARKP
jgi:hypothetical protein